MKTVIEMALEAGIVVTTDTPAQKENAQKVFERFAELVRTDEREACAKVVEKLHPGLSSPRIAEHIRARTSS